MNEEEILELVKREGNYKAGTYRGYKWRILRRNIDSDSIMHSIHLCGYVALPKGHKYYKKDYDSIPINCHGGLTYADSNLHLQPEKDMWWIGFDCAHSGDISYIMDNCDLHPWETYKDMKYVQKEIYKVIRQLGK